MINKLILILLLVAVVVGAATISQNCAGYDPAKITTVKDGDTLYRCNLAQYKDTMTLICTAVKNLVVIECNVTNCQFPKGTQLINCIGNQKQFCSNTELDKELPLLPRCLTKTCLHTKTITAISIDGKVVDSVRTYETKVFIKPVSAFVSTKDIEVVQ